MKNLNTILFCLLVLSYSIFAQEVDTKKLKAQEILAKAKSEIGNKIKFESVATLSLNYRTIAKFKDGTQAWESTETNDLYLISDKIRLDTFSDYGTNTSNTSLIVNGILFEKHFEVFVDGKKLNAAFNFSTPKEIQINNLKRDAWIMTFPIFLNSSLYQNLEFAYVGIAESKDTKAKIIQTTINERNYQIFIDEKTNFLLMMIETWKDKENKQFQTKYFLSDYREESDLLFAHKISFQSDFEKVGAGEIIIKTLKLNPTFKPNFFAVKEK